MHLALRYIKLASAWFWDQLERQKSDKIKQMSKARISKLCSESLLVAAHALHAALHMKPASKSLVWQAQAGSWTGACR